MTDPKDQEPAEGSRDIVERELQRQGETGQKTTGKEKSPAPKKD